jgi:pyruvate,water dikinase
MSGLLEEAARCADPALLGGKAARLAELANAGLPVPRFVVIPAPVAARIGGGPVDPALTAEIDGFLASATLADRFAVRSSAVGEDAAEASHAGQFATVIGVARSGVIEAVRQVLASAGRETAARYRERRGLGDGPIPMAVVIQVLVDARAAGVAFTADPVSETRTQVVVAALGLGAGVVDDRVPADTYRRRFGGLAWERTIAVKSERLVRSDDPGGIQVEPVPAQQAARPALAPAELEELGEALDRIDDAAAGPQDVEWAVDHEGQLWILQARPATAVPEPPLEVWDDSNIGENYPGFTRPLTFSLVRRTYQRLFSRAMAEAGVPAGSIAGQHVALARLLGLVRGRLYLNLTSYYAMFASVPGLEGTVGAWRAALGIQDRTRAPGRAGPVRRLGTWLRLGGRYLANDRRVAGCLTSTDRALARAARERPGPGSAAILEAFDRLEGDLLPGWTAIIYDDFFLFLLLDRLGRRLGGHAGTLHQLLGSGESRGMASLAAADSLRELADRALALPGGRDLLERGGDDRDTWEGLHRLDHDGAFRASAARHLGRHGDRGIGELKLETVTPADAPWTLVPFLRRAAAAPLSQAAAEPLLVARAKRAQALAQRLRGRPLARLIAGRLLSRCRRIIVHRENLSDARARAYGAIRRLFRALGAALAAEGHLEEPAQVFDLLLEDLEELAAGRMPPGELARLARSRRRRYARWAGEPAPPHRIVIGVGGPTPPPPSPDSADLHGTPCSEGVVTGPVRVVLEPTGVEDLRGEILVAPVTELGWLPLLLQARGLIVERGSILSHAAIIARELGLPTIVAVPGATVRLRDGDVVEMNGGTGSIGVRRR